MSAEIASASAAPAADLSEEAALRHAQAVVTRSGTSFGLGMRILPRARRQGMYAIYAYCREIDDIADEPGTPEEKLQALAAWRREIDRLANGTPEAPTARALQVAVRTFDLPKEELLLLLEGMEMDARGPIRAPRMDELLAYCRRVAGAVGLLSMRVFGAGSGQTADAFALALANALQLTNILRDVAEDATLGRLYLPREVLQAHGIDTTEPQMVLQHPNLPQVCAELGGMARGYFSEARRSLRHLDRSKLRPALLMMGIYEAYLKRMEQRGWDKAEQPVSLSKSEKLFIALRYMLRPPLNP